MKIFEVIIAGLVIGNVTLTILFKDNLKRFFEAVVKVNIITILIILAAMGAAWLIG